MGNDDENISPAICHCMTSIMFDIVWICMPQMSKFITANYITYDFFLLVSGYGAINRPHVKFLVHIELVNV